jgi:glutathione S-transferase
VNQLQLTIADLVVEAHDTHHPLGVGLYYEYQKPEARRRTAEFLEARAPKFLGYFEDLLKRNKSGWLVGRSLTYADLSLFQVVDGLRYAFPKSMQKLSRKHPRVIALHNRVMLRPRIEAYIASKRRIAFNEYGIFRRYPELDRS